MFLTLYFAIYPERKENTEEHHCSIVAISSGAARQSTYIRLRKLRKTLPNRQRFTCRPGKQQNLVKATPCGACSRNHAPLYQDNRETQTLYKHASWWRFLQHPRAISPVCRRNLEKRGQSNISLLLGQRNSGKPGQGDVTIPVGLRNREFSSTCRLVHFPYEPYSSLLIGQGNSEEACRCAFSRSFFRNRAPVPVCQGNPETRNKATKENPEKSGQNTSIYL